MMSGQLEDKVVVVTGAGSGMGAQFSRQLSAEGARVVACDVDETRVGRIASDIGAEARVFDVSDSAAFTQTIDSVVEHYGRIDGLVNNAGIAPTRKPDKTAIVIDNQMKRMEGRPDDMVPTNDTIDITDGEWDVMIRTHLYGTFHGTRAALAHMSPARQGSIVNISSILGLRPSAGAAHYCAAKAAIIAFTKSVAQEVAPFGVRLNTVCPGWVDTPLLDPFDDMTKAGIKMQIPVGRMAATDEIAAVVLFLLGSHSSYCIGDVFPVSGGWV